MRRGTALRSPGLQDFQDFGLGFGVQGFGFRVQGFEFEGSGFRVWGLGLGFGPSLGKFRAFSRLPRWRIVLELGSAASSRA